MEKPEIHLNYEIVLEDYVSADVAWYSRPNFQFIVTQLFPAVLLTYFFVSLVLFEPIFGSESELAQKTAMIEMGLCLISGILLATLMRPRNLPNFRRRALKTKILRNPELIGLRTAIINDQGIFIHRLESFQDLQIPWKRIQEINETKDLVLIYLKNRVGFNFIPKASFQSEQLELLRELFDRHCPQNDLGMNNH